MLSNQAKQNLKTVIIMYISTYTAQPKYEIEKRIESYKLSLEILEALELKGFKTINEAWRTIVKTRITKRELDKFSKLLGEKVRWSTQRYGNGYEFEIRGDTWQSNRLVLTVSLEELDIGRHYCGDSYNMDDHTIPFLIATCIESIAKNQKAMKLYDSIKMRIEAYENLIEESVKEAHAKYIEDIQSLVHSKSL